MALGWNYFEADAVTYTFHSKLLFSDVVLDTQIGAIIQGCIQSWSKIIPYVQKSSVGQNVNTGNWVLLSQKNAQTLCRSGNKKHQQSGVAGEALLGARFHLEKAQGWALRLPRKHLYFLPKSRDADTIFRSQEHILSVQISLQDLDPSQPLKSKSITILCSSVSTGK